MLTRIHNDSHAIDDGECVILVLLDFSAAFDTLDQDILITRLKPCFGITGKALGWIQSYLSGRTQFVKIGTERSSSRNLFCGAPQGSVLGPILHSMYTSPLTDIISKHNLNHHFCADDSQIYLSFTPSAAGEPTTSKLRIESCIHDVNNWMSANKLILNRDKTELLVLHARHRSPVDLQVTISLVNISVFKGRPKRKIRPTQRLLCSRKPIIFSFLIFHLFFFFYRPVMCSLYIYTSQYIVIESFTVRCIFSLRTDI